MQTSVQKEDTNFSCHETRITTNTLKIHFDRSKQARRASWFQIRFSTHAWSTMQLTVIRVVNLFCFKLTWAAFCFPSLKNVHGCNNMISFPLEYIWVLLPLEVIQFHGDKRKRRQRTIRGTERVNKTLRPEEIAAGLSVVEEGPGKN